jgi:hypothetical protein
MALRPCCLQIARNVDEERVPVKEDEENFVGGWYETMRLQASAFSASSRGRKLAEALAR